MSNELTALKLDLGVIRKHYQSSHLHTIILFTWTDYKTIFLPITSFASATAPTHSASTFLQVCWWTWLHLILCNVSNQSCSSEEDLANKPWRPLPSGRVTSFQATQLRWTMVFLCLIWSSTYGRDIFFVTLCLVIVTLLYDEVGLSNHPLGKNICNVGGYVTFEMGATKIMGNTGDLDTISKTAIILSALVIFTTIQAQDFQDIEGDKASNRITFPLYAPELSRLITLFIIPIWSMILCWVWNTGWLVSAIHVAFGSYIGFRYYLMRTAESDKVSYLIFNLWLIFSHLLPFHARAGVLDF